MDLAQSDIQGQGFSLLLGYIFIIYLLTSMLMSGTRALMARMPVINTSSSQRKSEDLVDWLADTSFLMAGTVRM